MLRKRREPCWPLLKITWFPPLPWSTALKTGLGLGVGQASTELEEVEAASDVEDSADSVVDWAVDPEVVDSVAEVDVADSVDDTTVVDSVESVVESALDTVVEAVSEVADSVEDATSVVPLDSVDFEVSVSVSADDVSVTVDDSDSSEEVTEVEAADDTVTTEEEPVNLQLTRCICTIKHSVLTRLWLAWRRKRLGREEAQSQRKKDTRTHR